MDSEASKKPQAEGREWRRPQKPKRIEKATEKTTPPDTQSEEVQTETEARTAIEQHFKNPSLTEELLTKHIPKTIKARLSDSDIKRVTEALDKEFAESPEQREVFEQILIEGDRKALENKTKKQLTQINTHYFGKHPLRHPVRTVKRQAKRKKFQKFVNALKPVRHDKKEFDVYKSPRTTGEIQSYGAQDLIAQADAYVYASFDGIRHHMTRSNEYLRELDSGEMESRGEIVMQDMANIEARHHDLPTSAYLNNVFDYKQGKDVLATYLAMVFESPQEATEFLQRNNRPQIAQHWERAITTSTNTLPAGVKRNDARYTEIRERMKEVLAKTGIEPPLSLEVRIRGQVDIAT